MNKLWAAACAAVMTVSVLTGAAGASTPVAAQSPAIDAPATPDQDPVARGIIVKTRAGAADPAIERATQRAADAEVETEVDVAGPQQLAGRVDTVDFDRLVPADEAADVATRLAARPDVEWAVPNRRVRAQAKAPVTTNDHYFTRQYQLWDSRTRRQSNGSTTPSGGYSVKAPALWRATKGTADVQVAVLDTGIRPDHPDLTQQLVAGYDMIDLDVDELGQPFPGVPTTYTANDGDGRDADPSDPGDWIPRGDRLCYGEPTPALEPSSWHGTHVAGIVAARAGNRVGISGVAPGVKVQPVRVLGRCGGYDSDILAGITWASGGAVAGVPVNTSPSQVVNLSLGSYLDTAAQAQAACPAYTEAIASAKARGAVTVIAAGNELGSVGRSVPAACGNDAIVVGATSEDGYRAFYSNRGSRVDLMAPGGDEVMAQHGVISTVNAGTTRPGTNTYAGRGWAGTSMAAPAVSGGVALLLSLGVDARNVKTVLKRTTAPFAPVRHSYDAVRLRDGAGRVHSAGNLNCRTTTTSCGTGILDLSRVPAPVGAPVITGQPLVGTSLTASTGTWNGTPAGYTYQWTRDGVDIAGATGRTYVVQAGDDGSRLAVRVSPTDQYLTSLAARSAPTLPVGSQVSLTAPTRGTYGRAAVLSVVGAHGDTPLSGRVQVRRGSTVLGSGVLTDGTVRITVPGTSWAGGVNALHAVVQDGSGTGRTSTSRVTIAKANPSAIRTSMKRSVSHRKKLSVSVRVVVPGVTRPVGPVRVYDGRRKVKGASLRAGAAGRITLVLPTLRRGSHVVRVRYAGSSTTAARWSGTTRVRVY